MTRYRDKAYKWQALLISLLLCLYSFAGISQANKATLSTPDEQMPVLLVMGDSLSAAFNIAVESGWVSLLEQRLDQSDTKDSWQVVNASISGETTSGGVARLPALLEEHKPAIVVLELGANDGLQARSTAQIKQNLQAMLGAINASDAQAVLVGMQIPDNYGPIYQQRFAEIFTALAEESSELVLVPFLLDGVAVHRDLMQADGLHPKATAQPRVLENVWPILSPLLSGEF